MLSIDELEGAAATPPINDESAFHTGIHTLWLPDLTDLCRKQPPTAAASPT